MMKPKGSGPASLRNRALAIALVMMASMAAPSAAEATDGLEVELTTSEDNVVLNSDVKLMVTVRDAQTGKGLEDCEVVVHIERRSSDDGDGGGHMHPEPVEVPSDIPKPSVAISVTPDPKAGWNLRVVTDNFTFAPWNASRGAVWGEGHAHLYIDDEKMGRLYGEWYHIGSLEAGTHYVRVTLNGNDHADLAVDGHRVQDTATVLSEGPGPHGHMTSRFEVPQGETAPTVDLQVYEDSKSGWNLQLATTGFRWAPENASSDPVMGEGHAHLYVDGHKEGRLYGEWFHLGALAPGEHELRVTLNANNHSDYSQDGVVVEDSETVTVPDDGDGHGGGAVTLTAQAGARAGEYFVRHNFRTAGDYDIEVHVTGAGHDEVSTSFGLKVYEGDPAALTIAGVVVYVALAVVVILAIQFAVSRRRARRLQQLMGGKG